MTSPVLANSRNSLWPVLSTLLACAIVGSQPACAQEMSPPASTAATGVSLPSSETDQTQPTELPDAPDAVVSAPAVDTSDPSTVASDLATWAAEPVSAAVTSGQLSHVLLDKCPFDTTRARECRVHWHQLIISSALFNTFQNAGNLYTGYWYRWETTHGKWFDRWINSAAGWRWNVWSDQNPFMDQYVGHSMMGAITNYLWIQNDPKGMSLEYSNTPEYWRSRLRAFIFSTAYSFEWKLGPFGEAGIGHNGDHLVPQNGNRPWTNETGWVELVTTPGGGLLWTMAEDEMDKHVVRRIESKPRRPVTLLLVSFLTPAKGTANILRFRSPWYRDDRQVKASSFFSEPPGTQEMAGASSPDTNDASDAAALSSSTGAVVPVHAAVLPVWPHYGGVHEFGAMVGTIDYQRSFLGFCWRRQIHARRRQLFLHVYSTSNVELSLLSGNDRIRHVRLAPARSDKPTNATGSGLWQRCQPSGIPGVVSSREPCAALSLDQRRFHLLRSARVLPAGFAIYVHHRFRMRPDVLSQATPVLQHRLPLSASVQRRHQPSQSGH